MAAVFGCQQEIDQNFKYKNFGKNYTAHFKLLLARATWDARAPSIDQVHLKKKLFLWVLSDKNCKTPSRSPETE